MQLIVLGMHRSGTSSVTRLLNLAGAYFGPEGMATAPNEENPKGFWERRDVRQVCDDLLFGGGFDWWRVAGFSVDQIPATTRAEGLDAFRSIVHGLEAHRPWVVKEPRLCLLLPILRPALEAPVVVHVTREPMEIAGSLAARNGFPLPVGIALWESYAVHALAAAGADPAVHVAYGDLIEDPVTTTTRLVEQLAGLGVQGLRVPSEREITAFVTPDLHRQRRRAADRRSYLNADQLALAASFDDGELGPGPGGAVSLGALETLRAFEASEALDTEVQRLRADLEAQRRELEREMEHLQAAHRQESEDALAAAELAQATVQDALVDLQDTLEDLQATTEERLQAAQRAEAAALEAIETAARRVGSVRGSGAVRLGARLSSLRPAAIRDPGLRVDAALRGALWQLEQARAALADDLGPDREPLAAPRAEPPSTEALQEGRRAARARGDRAKVAVLAWDIGHNPFARAHLLADLLRDRFDVEIWGAQFERYGSDIWAPLRQTDIPVERFPGRSFPEHLDVMEDMARRLDADAIVVSKPRLPGLGVAALAKELWNRPVVVDVDDFELSFFDELQGIDAATLAERHGDPDLLLPFGRLWTQACEHALVDADALTVSNDELAARYGGTIIPHVRDEVAFDPHRHDRTAARRRLGLGPDDRLVLFGGTPRAHKGIVDLLHAVDQLGDPRVKVGAFASRELEELLRDVGSLERWILPIRHHAMRDLPALLTAADLTCALQAADHPVSRYQIPAKVTDAMAMRVPCLVTPVPPLQPLIDKDVVEVFDGDVPLHERIGEVLAGGPEVADRASRAREVFLESFSYAAARPALSEVVTSALGSPRDVGPRFRALTAAVRASSRPTEVRPRPRRALPAGTTYDLAVFWKQNDTGIYGRRQDMFLLHLQRTGRFGNVVHFDQPMSIEGLGHLARRGLRSATDQDRLVLAQTARRLAHRSDHGALRQRTFLYSAGRVGRRMGLPGRGDHAAYVKRVLRREGFGRRPLLVWVYPTNPALPALLDALDPEIVVTDVVDDNRTWYEPGTPGYEQAERNYSEVLSRSDLVLANCEAVAESMRPFGPEVHVVPNACDLRAPAPATKPPADLAGLARPIIGYAGNLSDRIDIPLLRRIAQERRDWSIVLMGSAHLDRAALALESEPNVRFLGTKRYDEALELIGHFDVGLIPHVDNAMTRSMNPLKAYVYCSLGVPVVSTHVANIDEMASHITVATDPGAFIAAIDAAVHAGRYRPDPIALRPHSWEERAERVIDLIDQVATSRPTADD